MTEKEQFTAGVSLLAGALLSTLAMSLHPAGGNLREIAHMKQAMLFSHSIALCCIPMLAFGYRGLSRLLSKGSPWTGLGFSFIQFGLAGVLIAGTINGLVLPLFAISYQSFVIDEITAVAIIGYGSLFNHALAYIFIAAMVIAMSIWSGIIVRTNLLPRWLGIFGLGIVAAILIATGSQFHFTAVWAFRLLTFLLASWQLTVALLLMRMSPKNKLT
ncbi:MAG: hypothetical protein KGO82_17810 [Bacteroidota bacterium]|nr:hypothetical protein [Bacteroidota bacterium]